MPARASAPPRPAARARRPRAPRRASRVPRASPLDRIDPAAVVARLAEAALASPLVLKRCDDVRVVVDADLARALALGELGGARVRGRGWSSPRDLTARDVELVARDVRVDWSAAMAMRGVVLTRPARGEARLTLDGRDFENFLRHPLARRAARDEAFEFERGDVASDGRRRVPGVRRGDARRRRAANGANATGRGIDGSRDVARRRGRDARARVGDVFRATRPRFRRHGAAVSRHDDRRARDGADGDVRARSVRQKVSVARDTVLARVLSLARDARL